MARRPKTDLFTESVCTTIFGAFTFLYLMFYQNHLLAFVQHYLSQGVTTYHHLVGAIIITIILLLISLLTASLVRHAFHFLPAVFHLPSCLLLGVMTDVHLSLPSATLTMGHSWVVAVVLLVVLIVATILLRDNLITYKHPLQSFLANIVVLFVCLVLAVALGNTSPADHQWMEQALTSP